MEGQELSLLSQLLLLASLLLLVLRLPPLPLPPPFPLGALGVWYDAERHRRDPARSMCSCVPRLGLWLGLPMSDELLGLGSVNMVVSSSRETCKAEHNLLGAVMGRSGTWERGEVLFVACERGDVSRVCACERGEISRFCASERGDVSRFRACERGEVFR